MQFGEFLKHERELTLDCADDNAEWSKYKIDEDGNSRLWEKAQDG